MQHRNCIWLSAITAFGLVLPAAADDKDTIDKLQKENAELRKQLERERDVAKLNEVRAKAAAEEAIKAREETLKLLKDAEQEALKARRLEKDQAEAAKRFADESVKIAAQFQKAAEAAAKEAEARRQQAEKERAELTRAFEEAAKFREKAVLLEVELQLFKKRSQELEKRIVELEKARIGKDPIDNRPPANVRGKILKAGESVVLLSIGSDAGLSNGQKLDVYRPGKDPKSPKYLGTVTVIRVEPKQSAGKFVGTDKTIRPEEGDEVTSGINR